MHPRTWPAARVRGPARRLASSAGGAGRVLLLLGHPSFLVIYGWFTEGYDTADLQEAKGLLAAVA